MGSKLWRKLRKKFCLNIFLKCFEKSMHKKFVNYERISCLSQNGDILELLFCQSISHYVMLDKRIDDNYWCFHVQRLAQNNSYGVIKYEPLLNVLNDVFTNSRPVYRIRNQTKLTEKVLQLTENSAPDLTQISTLLKQYNNIVVKYDENYCNCEHYVTLWKYGIGWSHAINAEKTIVKTLKLFRKSFAKNIFNDSCIAITNQCISNIDCNIIIHCFGLFGQKLLDGIQYVMNRQKILIKV